MISQKNLELGTKSSVIREVFEYGLKRKAEIGEDKVFDYSLGNPNIPSPKKVNETLKKLIQESDPTELHGYSSGPGYVNVRKAVASYLNETYAVNESYSRIYMTCGAAASLTITLNALVCEGDEIIVLAPYFPEYKVFIEHTGAKVVEVMCDKETMQPDVAAICQAINEHTKGIILNSPNNPTGAVYSSMVLAELSSVLSEKELQYSHPIYVISDEPYRELVYESSVPYTAKIIKNTISCYSFSKSLSLPGERIGYICVCERCEDGDNIFSAICGAGRALGYVCAPVLFQKMIPEVLGATSSIDEYDKNRREIKRILDECGFKYIEPEGAFYIFIKSPTENARDFCEEAKNFELLLVRSDEFGCPGFVRIAYCVSNKMIKSSEEAWKKLAEKYRLTGERK
ncbi:MAG: pyridoxal phosphate-dependent aminotransferase [Clostridiales bacterium]|nr:pyridoxal phosphate-dependent aminotransferase [Clostridiales bacterium]